MVNKKIRNSRMGNLDLKIPQTRGVEFYPSCLEKGLRSEKALKLAAAEMYINGISTRRVEKVIKELCGLDISSSQVSRMTQELDVDLDQFRKRPLSSNPYVTLDAMYLKVRHNGTTIDRSILMAYEVNQFGRPEILGVSVSLSEAEVHWRDFLESLQKRGLTCVKLITSDNHSGLKTTWVFGFEERRNKVRTVAVIERNGKITY